MSEGDEEEAAIAHRRPHAAARPPARRRRFFFLPFLSFSSLFFSSLPFLFVSFFPLITRHQTTSHTASFCRDESTSSSRLWGSMKWGFSAMKASTDYDLILVEWEKVCDAYLHRKLTVHILTTRSKRSS